MATCHSVDPNIMPQRALLLKGTFTDTSFLSKAIAGLNLDPLMVRSQTISCSSSIETSYSNNKPHGCCSVLFWFLWITFLLIEDYLRPYCLSNNNVFGMNKQNDQCSLKHNCWNFLLEQQAIRLLLGSVSVFLDHLTSYRGLLEALLRWWWLFLAWIRKKDPCSLKHNCWYFLLEQQAIRLLLDSVFQFIWITFLLTKDYSRPYCLSRNNIFSMDRQKWPVLISNIIQVLKIPNCMLLSSMSEQLNVQITSTPNKIIRRCNLQR